jgi:hypothetical protein
MAINWPNLSQGTNIGQLYTSSNGDVWRWNGYGWDVSNLQSSGSYGGPWIIFDSVENPNYYSTLNLALSAAVAGDTIYLATEVTETIDSTIVLKDGVNINLNGCTYYFYYSNSWIGDLIGFISSINIKCNIQNGTIRFLNEPATGFFGIIIYEVNSEFDMSGLNMFINSSACGFFYGSLTGGYFCNLSTNSGSVGVYLISSAGNSIDNPKIFRNIKGESVGGVGIYIGYVEA